MPLGPGSSLAALARPGHVRGERTPRATSRLAREPLAVIPIHDVKQRSVLRSRGALLRPGLSVSSHVPSLVASTGEFGTGGRRDSSNSVPPMRGGWSADRPHSFFGRACDARPPVPGRPGRSPLGAPPWRFSAADPRSQLPALGHRSLQRAASRQAIMPGGRCPGPPEPAVTSRGRGTPLLAPSCRIVSRRRPSMSEDANRIPLTRYVVNSVVET